MENQAITIAEAGRILGLWSYVIDRNQAICTVPDGIQFRLFVQRHEKGVGAYLQHLVGPDGRYISEQEVIGYRETRTEVSVSMTRDPQQAAKDIYRRLCQAPEAQARWNRVVERHATEWARNAALKHHVETLNKSGFKMNMREGASWEATGSANGRPDINVTVNAEGVVTFECRTSLAGVKELLKVCDKYPAPRNY